MRHAVIMAGGSGTRLWPLSRKRRPKQLLRLFEGASLLQLARRRLEGLFAPENTWVITSANYIDQVAAELPDLPRGNLIGEPMGRDTANAIGLAANLLARRDPDATMAVFTADHIIRPQERFTAAIQAGLEAAESLPESLVTFGIKPHSPQTGYGYIRRGAVLGPGTYRVAEFKEKPTRAVAEAYLRSGAYYWNSGMFAWRARAILAEIGRLLPENARGLAELGADWAQLAGTEAARQQFERLRRVSIDFGVMERAARVLVVEMDCDWQDLGSWAAVAATRPADADGNVVGGASGLFVQTQGNVVVSEDQHLVVMIGVSDVVVVHSGDATLVCRRDAVEQVKDVVGLISRSHGAAYE
jgi:mannose-1-phosphate guanylyltransferase